MSDKKGMDGEILSIQSILSGEPLKLEIRPPNAADARSLANWQSNSAALDKTQPDILQWLKEIPIPLQWTFGRDGYLTARDGATWFTGCSVPLLAARAMLKSLELVGTVGCFVCPWHAGQLRACFEKIQTNQAIIAIVADPLTLAVMLRCDDFSPEMQSGRLYFAAGWNWAEQLAEIFKTHPGLPTPLNFVRTVLLDDTELNRFTAEAQLVVAAETNRRTQRIALARDSRQRRYRAGASAPRTRRVLVIAPGHFHLSDLSGIALRAALCQAKPIANAFADFDPDEPNSASPLAAALAAENADAIVATNTYRKTLSGVIADSMPWITWVTQGPNAIQAPEANSPNDRLLLADPNWRDAARSAGWSDDRIDTASWPAFLGLEPPATPRRGSDLGLLADTCSLAVPERLKGFSSHAVLWELIAKELLENPLLLRNDAQEYLRHCMNRLNVAGETFDAPFFLDRLILPAYHQGLVRGLISAGLQVAPLGKGWAEIPEFAGVASEEIRGAAEIHERLSRCAALIHPMPVDWANAVDSLGLPVIQPAGMGWKELIAAAKSACAGRKRPPANSSAPLSRGRVLSQIAGFHWEDFSSGHLEFGCD
jgi:hypothetical protein